MISGMVVNRKVYKILQKLPPKEVQKTMGIPIVPYGCVHVFLKPYIKSIKVFDKMDELLKYLRED